MSPHDLDALIDAMARAVDVPIPAESRTAVAANLARLHALAAEVERFGAPDARTGEGDAAADRTS